MDPFDARSVTGSLKNSPQRVLTKSYPPTAKHKRGHGISMDAKLADLMDEDEVKWMSNAESSRSPTPQIVHTPPRLSAQKHSRHGSEVPRPTYEQQRDRRIPPLASNVVRMETPPPIATPTTYARNMTPPLPPLRPGFKSPPLASTLLASSIGLTALPQRKTNFSTFAQRVFLAGKSDLLYDYTEKVRWPWHFKNYKHGCLDIATLASMQKHVTQQKLVEQARAIGERGAWMEIGVADTIREYCQVLRDLEYMRQHSFHGRNEDPFLINTVRPLEAQLLQDAGMARCKEQSSDDKQQHLISRPSRLSPCRQAFRRLAVLLLIGVALIMPYLIAVLRPAQLTRIVTVCACIVAFAIATAMISLRRHSPKWPAGLMLIYAAALVILIGVNPLKYSDG